MNEEWLKKHIDLRKEANEVIALIIYETVSIEREIDNYILNHFVKEDKSNEFSNDILADERFPASLKVKVMMHSGELEKQGYNGVKKDLMRLFEIRNIVAHNISNILENPKILIKKDLKINLYELWTEFSDIHMKLSLVFLRIRIYPERLFKESFKEEFYEYNKRMKSTGEKISKIYDKK